MGIDNPNKIRVSDTPSVTQYKTENNGISLEPNFK